MRAILTHTVFLWVIRVILGGVFIYAGALKIADPLAFADNIHQYEILPGTLINLVALCLPVFECVAGALLLSSRLDRLASGSIILMGMVFGVALVSVITRGMIIDCGCLGGSEPSRWSAWYALGRDVLILGGAGWIYLSSKVKS